MNFTQQNFKALSNIFINKSQKNKLNNRPQKKLPYTEKNSKNILIYLAITSILLPINNIKAQPPNTASFNRHQATHAFPHTTYVAPKLDDSQKKPPNPVRVTAGDSGSDLPSPEKRLKGFPAPKKPPPPPISTPNAPANTTQKYSSQHNTVRDPQTTDKTNSPDHSFRHQPAIVAWPEGPASSQTPNPNKEGTNCAPNPNKDTKRVQKRWAFPCSLYSNKEIPPSGLGSGSLPRDELLLTNPHQRPTAPLPQPIIPVTKLPPDQLIKVLTSNQDPSLKKPNTTGGSIFIPSDNDKGMSSQIPWIQGLKPPLNRSQSPTPVNPTQNQGMNHSSELEEAVVRELPSHLQIRTKQEKHQPTVSARPTPNSVVLSPRPNPLNTPNSSIPSGNSAESPPHHSFHRQPLIVAHADPAISPGKNGLGSPARQQPATAPLTSTSSLMPKSPRNQADQTVPLGVVPIPTTLRKIRTTEETPKAISEVPTLPPAPLSQVALTQNSEVLSPRPRSIFSDVRSDNSDGDQSPSLTSSSQPYSRSNRGQVFPLPTLPPPMARRAATPTQNSASVHQQWPTPPPQLPGKPLPSHLAAPTPNSEVLSRGPNPPNTPNYSISSGDSAKFPTPSEESIFSNPTIDDSNEGDQPPSLTSSSQPYSHSDQDQVFSPPPPPMATAATSPEKPASMQQPSLTPPPQLERKRPSMYPKRATSAKTVATDEQKGSKPSDLEPSFWKRFLGTTAGFGTLVAVAATVFLVLLL